MYLPVTLMKRMQAKRSCLSLHPACGCHPHCNLYSRELAGIFDNISALLLFNLSNITQVSIAETVCPYFHSFNTGQYQSWERLLNVTTTSCISQADHGLQSYRQSTILERSRSSSTFMLGATAFFSIFLLGATAVVYPRFDVSEIRKKGNVFLTLQWVGFCMQHLQNTNQLTSGKCWLYFQNSDSHPSSKEIIE